MTKLNEYEVEQYKKLMLVLEAAQLHATGLITISTAASGNVACSVVLDGCTVKKFIKELP